MADYVGASAIGPDHVIASLDILEGKATMEEQGRPVSPLLRRGRPEPTAEVRGVVQRWFDDLGSDVSAQLSPESAEELRKEMERLR